MAADRRDAALAAPAGGDIADAGLETYLLHLLAAASNHRDRELGRRFEALGLTVDKYRSMLAIARFPGCTMKELAQFTSIDRTTLTRMVDQMVAMGWVTRAHSSRDRRQVVLGLTPQGMDLGQQAVEILKDANRRAAADLTPEEIQAATRALEAVLRNLIPDSSLLTRVITLRRPTDGAI